MRPRWRCARGASCWFAANHASKSTFPIRAPSPGVSSPPCSSVPYYRACGSAITARLSPVAANSRRAQASMPSASGPPSSMRPPTGAPTASSATVAATSLAATNSISPVDSGRCRPRRRPRRSGAGTRRTAWHAGWCRGWPSLDFGLLGELDTQVATVGQAVGADDRDGDVVADASLALGRLQVARRGRE